MCKSSGLCSRGLSGGVKPRKKILIHTVSEPHKASRQIKYLRVIILFSRDASPVVKELDETNGGYRFDKLRHIENYQSIIYFQFLTQGKNITL